MRVTYRLTFCDLYLVTLRMVLPFALGCFLLGNAYHVARVSLSPYFPSVTVRFIEIAIRVFLTTVLLCALVLATPLISAWMQRRLLNTQSTAEIHEHGICDTSELARQDFRWTAVAQPRWIFRRIVIRMEGGRALIIPERSFRSQSEADSFFNEVKHRKRQADHG